MIFLVRNDKNQGISKCRAGYEGDFPTKEDFTVPAISDDLQSRINEIQAIASSIDTKVVAHEIDDPAKYKIDYKGELNPQQLSAVLETKNPLLVIAGAGS